MTQASLTELEAVNLMLSAIGESPINDLDADPTSDAAIAVSLLRDTSREVQERGWHFNSESEFPLAPDESGFVFLPLNVARVDISPRYRFDFPDIVQRGLQLYDRSNRTLVFTKELKVDLVLYLDWESLPPAAKRYISLRAARIFAARVLGDQNTVGYSAMDEMEAKALLMSAETDTADYSILDKWEVGRSLRRF